MTVKRQDIVDALREMGIEGGGALLVHSSLSSMGYVEGGADTVVDALLEVLGEEGTLMVPTFTHSGTEYYDPLTSPSKNGAITEAVRRRPAAVRSLHPTHAPTAIGRYAEAFMRDHLKRGPLGVDCPVDRLARQGGWVLLLGVGHTSNSIIHVGEAHARSPSLTVRYSPQAPKWVILKHPDKGEMEVTVQEMPGCSAGFVAVEKLLRRRRRILDGRIGRAPCQLMKGQDLIDTTVELLTRDPYGLLCSRPECSGCREARKVLDRSVRRR